VPHAFCRCTRRCTAVAPSASLEPPSEQAHVPAEQSSPCEDPRLSAPHANACRPGNPRRSPPEGSSGPLGLTTTPGLPVLAAASRLRHRSDFVATVRHGRRAGRMSLVAHLLPVTVTPVTPVTGATALSPARVGIVAPAGARVGFIVPRTVGGAVVRNRIRRQLRHLVRPRLADLPVGSRLVVRVLPAAATVTGANLAADLDAALARCAPAVLSGRSC
jgi:ribonuclease P protein component